MPRVARGVIGKKIDKTLRLATDSRPPKYQNSRQDGNIYENANSPLDVQLLVSPVPKENVREQWKSQPLQRLPFATTIARRRFPLPQSQTR